MMKSSGKSKSEFSGDYINVIRQLPYELLTDEEKRDIRHQERANLSYERFLRRMGIAYKGQLTPTEVKVLRRRRKRYLEHQRMVEEHRRSRLEPSPQALHKVPEAKPTPNFFFRLWPTGEIISYERFMREYWPSILKRFKEQEKSRSRSRKRTRENAYELFRKKFVGGE